MDNLLEHMRGFYHSKKKWVDNPHKDAESVWQIGL